MKFLITIATLKVLNRRFVEARDIWFRDVTDLQHEASAKIAADNYFLAVQSVARDYRISDIDLAWQLTFQVKWNGEMTYA